MTNHRVTILKEIARLYPELIDPTNSRGADRSGDGSLALMPLTYTPTVKEYERLVKTMRDDRSEPLLDGKVSVRSLWWHLEHWHHRAERVVKHYPVTSKAGGKITTLKNRDGTPVTRATIVHLRDPKASEAKAERALEWIAQHWNLTADGKTRSTSLGEPMLPAPVVEGFKAAA